MLRLLLLSLLVVACGGTEKTIRAGEPGPDTSAPAQADAAEVPAAPMGCVLNGEERAAGESYFDGCNTCRCDDSGHAVCTLLACELKILDVIVFAKNDRGIDAHGQTVIAMIAKVLSEHPELDVKIVGHSAPGEQRPMPLSDGRAAAVKDALVAAGIATVRLKHIGVGDMQPLTPDAAAARTDPSERRVSFEVIKRP